MFVVVDGQVAGILGCGGSHQRSHARRHRRACTKRGVRVVMLTGDNRKTADAVAAKLSIDEVIAELLPDQKAQAVKRLAGSWQRGGHGRRRNQ